VFPTDEPLDGVRERVGRERTCGHDRRHAVRRGQIRYFPADDRDQRVAGNRGGDHIREAGPVDRERGAGRDTGVGRGPEHEGTEPAHLLLQEAHRVIEFVAAERVAADELRQPVGLVHRGRPRGTHLVQHHAHAAPGSLPRRLGPRKAAADDADHRHSHFPLTVNR
jgi:hypothetical protein